MAEKTCRRAGALLPVAVAVAIMALAANAVAAAPAAKETKSGAARRGEAIFQQRCVVCHNKKPGDTTPFGPPNLFEVFKGKPALSNQQAEQIILHGKGQMPSFNGVLTHAEINDVLAYFRSHPPAKK